MNLLDAISDCHVRSAVRQRSNPQVKYWKNHPISIFNRIPVSLQDAVDWEEYDPRDADDGSLYMYND